MADGPTYLIIGNGIAGITAAEVLRTEDSAATIAVIADDPFPVYYRPALKDYLAGRVREDKLWARPRSFYQDHNIYFHSDRVIGISTDQHVVHLQSKRRLPYQRLLLANGARAATLQCPGMQLEGVTTLRTVADYQKVLQRLHTVKRVVVSGSGTLALETVETLRHRGLQVSHSLRRRMLWSEVLDVTASDLVLQQERRDGVDVRLEEEIAEIRGTKGTVTGVVTTQGSHIACEMVLIAIGIEPILDFARSSGIACGRGIQVDGKMRTNVADVYAAGDILETKDTLTGRTRAIGQWYPAVQQARAAAYSMLDLLDTNRPFSASTFYNATFLYGLDFASVGPTNAKGYQEVIADPQPRTYRKVLLKDNVPVGMLNVGKRREALAFKRAIDHRVNLSSVLTRLFADDFSLNAWLDKQGVPPPRLGVTREGNEAIKQAAYPGGTLAGTHASKESFIEAVLVPLPEHAKDYRLADMSLSQTRVIAVGRQPGIAMLIDHGTISRRHAEISYANGQYILRDLGSSNGTFVDGTRLEAQRPHVLKANEIIRFGGRIKYTFVQRVVNKHAQKPAGGSVSMAGVTMLYELDQEVIPLGLPMLNPDGSLLLPGTDMPIPAHKVATFKDGPALIVSIRGGAITGENRSPAVYPLKRGKRITIGRDEGNGIRIVDIAISRHHAEIFPGPDGFYVRDLGSSNGIVVNSTRIDNPYLLSHGDHMNIGSNIIYFVDLQATPRIARETEKVNAVAQQSGYATVAMEPQQSASFARQAQLIVCHNCGMPNMPLARFCASCSAALGVPSKR